MQCFRDPVMEDALSKCMEVSCSLPSLSLNILNSSIRTWGGSPKSGWWWPPLTWVSGLHTAEYMPSLLDLDLDPMHCLGRAAGGGCGASVVRPQPSAHLQMSS